MDELRWFAKSKNKIDSPIFSEKIRMQLGIKKCGVLTTGRGKRIRTYAIGLPDGQDMKDIDRTGYTYVGMLETDKMKENEMKEKFSKEYLRRLRLILRPKFNGINKIMAINTWTVSVMRYGAKILKWNTYYLNSLGRKTRKFMTMYGALYPKSDVDRVYLRRKIGRRGLISCE